MRQATPENVRFHAAGHIAAAAALVNDGEISAARRVMAEVVAYVHHVNVVAPPQLIKLVIDSAADPSGHIADLGILEQWFCDPFNTVIENGGNPFLAH